MRVFNFLIFSFLFNVAIFGVQSTFVLRDIESGQLLKQDGDIYCEESPCSTFKIALSLMGYDSEILEDVDNPLWPFKEEYKAWNPTFFLDIWAAAHSPKTWIQHSCVWFSQLLTQTLGFEAFESYVAAFDYGNQILLGDPGKNNALIRAWLSGNLKISPIEQTSFIRQLVNDTLPVSLHAHEMTRAILFVEYLPNGWALYGKTGSDGDGLGWFVGWIENHDKKLSFAHLLKGNASEKHVNGPMAREHFKQKILTLNV